MSDTKGAVTPEDKDDFWDIDKLLPKRRASLSPFASTTPVHLYTMHAEEAPRRAPDERKLELSHSSSVTEDTSYIPENHTLIKRVTIKRIIDKYDFYDAFRKSALLYYDCKGVKCEFAQFYSYMPQYSHMSASQKNYYFFWREEMRHGRFIKTDYSYLYLYVYEILNLPDRIPPKEGVRLLCTVWREYRGVLPRIDLYFSIWVRDYCLVHALPVPHSELSGFIYECINASTFKEFYLSDIREVGFSGIEALLAYLSDYDWRRGKFASGNDSGKIGGAITDDVAYKQHMQRAMYLLLTEVWDALIESGAQTSVITQNAFPNSLCTHAVKCKLEIEYISLRASEEQRRAVTAAVRYTENKLRALLGVKSRLAVVGLPDSYRRIIDRYFETLFVEERRRAKEAARPAYEKLYEAPHEKLSFEGADEIERASWITTARLVESDTEQSGEEELPLEVPCACASAVGAPSVAIGGDLIYLARLVGMEVEAVDTSNASQDPEEAIAERINETFLDVIGDVVLEDTGAGYSLIEDYREDVREWLMKQIG